MNEPELLITDPPTAKLPCFSMTIGFCLVAFWEAAGRVELNTINMDRRILKACLFNSSNKVLCSPPNVFLIFNILNGKYPVKGHDACQRENL